MSARHDARVALVEQRRAEILAAFPEALPEDVTTAATEDHLWIWNDRPDEGATWREYLSRMAERGRTAR
jgi:hypothetical protein